MGKSGDRRLAESQIDANLRRIFEEDAEQDLPQELIDLLDRLDSVPVPDSLRPGGGRGGDAEGEA